MSQLQKVPKSGNCVFLGETSQNRVLEKSETGQNLNSSLSFGQNEPEILCVTFKSSLEGPGFQE